MASENVMELTTANWEQEVVQSDKPVLVDFWAPWCGPCRLLAPTVDKIAEQFAGRVKVGKLNIDDSSEVAVRYRISSIPQLLVFKGGPDPRERTAGLASEKDVAGMLERVLAG